MSSKGKYIGLNQRIPFDVLDSAINFYIENGLINKEIIFKWMQEMTSGANRANKATTYVVQILTRQQRLLDQLKNSINSSSYGSLSIDDRKALCLCCISLTYPITYHLLISLSQGFKAQSQINKSFINEKVMSVYGSNRTVDIAIDALIPMIIELNTIKREKIGIYALGSKIQISNRFISTLVIYVDIKLSGSKTIITNELNHRPWYIFFNLSSSLRVDQSELLTRRESATGNSYLIIR